MSEMKLSEAIREISKFKSLFQSAEKLEEVLATVRKAQTAAGAAEIRRQNALKETQKLNKEILDLNESIKTLSTARKNTIVDLDDQYKKRHEDKKSDFLEFAKTCNQKQKTMEIALEKAKASHSAQMHDMQKESSEISTALADLSRSRDVLRKHLQAV